MIKKIDTSWLSIDLQEAVYNYEDRIRLDEKFKSFQLVLKTNNNIFEALNDSLIISDDDLYKEICDQDLILTKEKFFIYSAIKEDITKIEQKTLLIDQIYRMLDKVSVWSAWSDVIQQIVNNIDNLKNDCTHLFSLIEKWWVVSLRIPVSLFISNLNNAIKFIAKYFPKSNEVFPIKS